MSGQFEDAPTHKCVGHDHEHHGKKGGKAGKNALDKKSDGGSGIDSVIDRVMSDDMDKIVEKVTVPDKVVELVNHFKAYGTVPEKVYLNKKDLNKKLPMGSKDKANSKVEAQDNFDEEEKTNLPEKVENLSNRFKTYGDALDYVYRDTISSKKKDDDKDMSDSEGSNVENKKKKLARLSTVLKNHRGNLNKVDKIDKVDKKGIAIDIAKSVSAAAPVYRVCKESEVKVIGNSESASRRASGTDLKVKIHIT